MDERPINPIASSYARWLLPMAVVASLGVPASAAAWTEREPCAGCESGWDAPQVADGRVWWLASTELSGTAGQRWPEVTVRYVVRSRTLAGRDRRAVRLQTDALTPPPPVRPGGGVFDQYSRLFFGGDVRDGVVAGSGSWRTPRDDPRSGRHWQTSEVRTVASFDAKTGALLSERHEGQPPIPIVAASGDPWVQVPFAAANADQGAINGRTGQRYPVRAWGPEVQVRGGYLLRFDGPKATAEAWSRGQGTLSVVRLSTGRVVYRLSAKRVRRAGGYSSKVLVQPQRLQEDGSLEISAGSSRAARRGLRAVWVDSKGRSRRGPWIRDAVGVSTVARYGRLVLSIDQETGSGSRTKSCESWWASTPNGGKARRLSRVDSQRFARQDLVYWDRQKAIFTLRRASADGRTGFRVETAPHRLRLTRTFAPRC